jgi:uncharacterized protein (TIGR00299 family) protein
MIIGALLDAGLPFDDLKNELAKLNLTDYEVKCEKVVKNHISGSKFDVLTPLSSPLKKGGERVGPHGKGGKSEIPYRHLKNLNDIVDRSSLDEKLKFDAKRVFHKIAAAEAKIHNQPIEKVHFHEIGALDTIIDVVGALAGLKLLGVEKVYCSKVNVGSGFVTFSHGTFPVPAPATAEILKGAPIYSGEVAGELTTPTGAAIITTIAETFGALPAMITERIGYGAGAKDLPTPNLLRVFIGALDESVASGDQIAVIETNIDDMNPQLYEHVMEKLFAAGALEVFLTNVLMKKNRPGVKVTALAHPQDQDRMVKILFEETTTIGLRVRQENRKILHREIKEVETKFGKVRFKFSSLDGKILNAAPEFEDCKKIARQLNLPLKQVLRELAAVNV